METAASVRITGPLVPFRDGFTAKLVAQRYTDLSVRNQLYLMAHLSRWLIRTGIPLAEFSLERVRQFVRHRRRTRTAFRSERGLAPLLSHLRSLGVIPPGPAPAPPRHGLLGRYEQYLTMERPVLPERRRQYLAFADEFLSARDPAQLTAGDVSEFLAPLAPRPAFGERLTALRSLLQFLIVDGASPRNLTYAVPSGPGWRHTALPKPLEHTELQAVLATCDRRTTTGVRDYAALLLMARLGLRAGEVAALMLDDIDWVRGEIVVHGKGGTVGRLPLPADVGAAMAAYLRRHPRREHCRAVFLQAIAPYHATARGTVSALAQRALRIAGVASGGAHRLRHTAATRMLREGASLTEIAQVLGHRHLDTTSIYAKVDHERLRMLARPWPSDGIDTEQLRRLALAWPGGAP